MVRREEEEEEEVAVYRDGEEERCEGTIIFTRHSKKLLFTRLEDPAFRSVLVFIYFCHRRNRFGLF